MHALRLSLQDAIKGVEPGISGPSIFSAVRITYTVEKEEEEEEEVKEEEEKVLGSAPEPLSSC